MQICPTLTGKREIYLRYTRRIEKVNDSRMTNVTSRVNIYITFVSFRFDFQRYSLVAIFFNAFASEAINEERPCYFIDREQFVRFHARLWNYNCATLWKGPWMLISLLLRTRSLPDALNTRGTRYSRSVDTLCQYDPRFFNFLVISLTRLFYKSLICFYQHPATALLTTFLQIIFVRFADKIRGSMVLCANDSIRGLLRWKNHASKR